MASVVMNLYKGQRIDITAMMKDADTVLEAFAKNNIHFDKKFTTISGKGPSTITFKGLKAEKYHSDVTELIVSLHKQASDGEIGNVYVKITGYSKFQKTKPQDDVIKESTTSDNDTDGDHTTIDISNESDPDTL